MLSNTTVGPSRPPRKRDRTQDPTPGRGRAEVGYRAVLGLRQVGAAPCYTKPMPTAHRRHSITETPALAEVLAPLRARLGDDTPPLGELVRRGALTTLRELEAQDQAKSQSLSTFVDRLRAGPPPDLQEVERIRRSSRRP